MNALVAVGQCNSDHARMDFLVLVPPLLAIALALWTRQVYLSLFVGLWFGATLLAGGNLLSGLVEVADQLVAVFADPGNTRIVIFCLLVGGLIALVQASGGVAGFINLIQRRGWGKTRRSAELLAVIVGLVVFVESSITSLAVGATSRPLFDRLRLAREKLAYYCDATSAPVCMMLPLNGWGAYVLGLLAVQGYQENSVGLLLAALGFNFFAIGAIVFAIFLALTGWSFGPMKAAERRAAETGAVIRPGSKPMIADEVASIEPGPNVALRASNFLLPLAMMITVVLFGLWWTGDGDIRRGSGSTSVLWGVSAAILLAIAWYQRRIDGTRVMPIAAGVDWVVKGMSGLIGPTVLIVFAFALGQVSRALEIGPFVVALIGGDLSAWWLPMVTFLLGCFISFTLGSSWTTFAILIPLALPLGEQLSLPLPLMLGAVLSGGVFGDHVSPLSDTSIISSMAAACDHVDHINTQLPYALLLAALAASGFAVAGIFSGVVS